MIKEKKEETKIKEWYKDLYKRRTKLDKTVKYIRFYRLPNRTEIIDVILVTDMTGLKSTEGVNGFVIGLARRSGS